MTSSADQLSCRVIRQAGKVEQPRNLAPVLRAVRSIMALPQRGHV